MTYDNLVRKINLSLTNSTKHLFISTWQSSTIVYQSRKMGVFRVLSEFSAECGVQYTCTARNFNHAVNNPSTNVFLWFCNDFCSSFPDIQAKMKDSIHCMIDQRIYWTETDSAMAQPHHYQGSIDEHVLHYVPHKLMEPPNNLFNLFSKFVATTETCIWFPADLPMCRSATTSSSQPVPYSNRNSNDITDIASIEYTELVNWSLIVEGAMSLGC